MAQPAGRRLSAMNHPPPNIDPNELARFNALASRWWDPSGETAMLHRMNPARLEFIRSNAPLTGQRCLDVGCGGGIAAESLAREAAIVTAIDLAMEAIEVARLHQIETGLSNLSYRSISAEDLAAEEPGAFDVVTCLELLEHVPDPSSLVLACARLARPGGKVFFSTINRGPRAYAMTILGAEYLLRLLPAGTHDFSRFLRPSELDEMGRQAALRLDAMAGLVFDPATGDFSLGEDVSVNYITCFSRPAAR